MKRIGAAIAAKQLLLDRTCKECRYRRYETMAIVGCGYQTKKFKPLPKEGTCENFDEPYWPKHS